MICAVFFWHLPPDLRCRKNHNFGLCIADFHTRCEFCPT